MDSHQRRRGAFSAPDAINRHGLRQARAQERPTAQFRHTPRLGDLNATTSKTR